MKAPIADRTLEMLRLYQEEHLTMGEIGKRYGISTSRVQQLLAPFPKEQRKPRRYDERNEEIRQAHARIVAGESTTEQEVERLGYRSSANLYTALSRLGLRLTQPRGPEHGTLYRYKRFKCRCDACREAAHDYYVAQRAREPARHGTVSGYRNFGCKCPKCAAANRKHKRKLRRERRRREEPAAV